MKNFKKPFWIGGIYPWPWSCQDRNQVNLAEALIWPGLFQIARNLKYFSRI